jgi:hypothetical protein
LFEYCEEEVFVVKGMHEGCREFNLFCHSFEISALSAPNSIHKLHDYPKKYFTHQNPRLSIRAQSQASSITTLKCNHPSAYAASRINSSSGARNGTGAPCNIGSASIASLLLGNKLGNNVFNAEPKVCTSRFWVVGGMRVCTILKEP